MHNLDPDTVRQHVIDTVERNRQAVADLNDAIFWFAEPGLQEHETSALMCSLLEEAGFDSVRWRRLPASPQARGPGLFVAIGEVA